MAVSCEAFALNGTNLETVFSSGDALSSASLNHSLAKNFQLLAKACDYSSLRALLQAMQHPTFYNDSNKRRVLAGNILRELQSYLDDENHLKLIAEARRLLDSPMESARLLRDGKRSASGSSELLEVTDVILDIVCLLLDGYSGESLEQNLKHKLHAIDASFTKKAARELSGSLYVCEQGQTASVGTEMPEFLRSDKDPARFFSTLDDYLRDTYQATPGQLAALKVLIPLLTGFGATELLGALAERKAQGFMAEDEHIIEFPGDGMPNIVLEIKNGRLAGLLHHKAFVRKSVSEAQSEQGPALVSTLTARIDMEQYRGLSVDSAPGLLLGQLGRIDPNTFELRYEALEVGASVPVLKPQQLHDVVYQRWSDRFAQVLTRYRYAYAGATLLGTAALVAVPVFFPAVLSTLGLISMVAACVAGVGSLFASAAVASRKSSNRFSPTTKQFKQKLAAHNEDERAKLAFAAVLKDKLSQFDHISAQVSELRNTNFAERLRLARANMSEAQLRQWFDEMNTKLPADKRVGNEIFASWLRKYLVTDPVAVPATRLGALVAQFVKLPPADSIAQAADIKPYLEKLQALRTENGKQHAEQLNRKPIITTLQLLVFNSLVLPKYATTAQRQAAENLQQAVFANASLCRKLFLPGNKVLAERHRALLENLLIQPATRKQMQQEDASVFRQALLSWYKTQPWQPMPDAVLDTVAIAFMQLPAAEQERLLGLEPFATDAKLQQALKDEQLLRDELPTSPKSSPVRQAAKSTAPVANKAGFYQRPSAPPTTCHREIEKPTVNPNGYGAISVN